MQEKSDSLRIFLDSVDTLAVLHDFSTVQTCAKIGLSRSLYYQIKDGKRPITDKVWRKLDEAKRTAGIGEKKPGDVFRSGDVKEFHPPIEKNLPVPQGVMATAKEVHDLRDTVAGLREQVARLERMMLRLLDSHQTDAERSIQDRTLDGESDIR